MTSTLLVLATVSFAGSLFFSLYQHHDGIHASFFIILMLLCSLQLLLLASWSILIYPNFISPLRHLPGPKGDSLFMGQFHAIRKRTFCEPYREWIETIPNQGIVRYKFIFRTERLLLTSPKAISEVLVNKGYEFTKPIQLRQALSKVVGWGVIVQEGQVHKHQRKYLAPAFSSRSVKDLYPVFWAKAKELTDHLSNLQCRTKTKPRPAIFVNINDWASRATLDMVGIAAMGRDFGSISDPVNELARCYGELRRILLSKTTPSMAQIIMMFIPSADLGMRRAEFSEEVNAIRRIIRAFAQEKSMVAKQGNAVGGDALSVGLNSGAFTGEELVDQVMTILMAGQETTTASIAWAVYALCKYPDVQSRLRQEILQAHPSIHDANMMVEANDTDRMPYLLAFSNEVFRVFPPAPRTIRVPEHDTTILGQPVPKGTPVIICPWAVNVSTELWGHDAHDFKPERWLEPGSRANTGGATSNYAFLSFLHGPRSYLGMGIARGEFACILMALVGRFEMEFTDPDYELVVSTGLSIRPSIDFSVRLRSTK